MTFIYEKVRETLKNLSSCIVTERRGVGDISFTRCGYKTENVPAADAAWEPLANGAPIAFAVDEHAWLRFAVDVPECAANEAYFLRVTTGKEGQWDARNPQCTIYIDGTKAAQAMDTNHTEMLIGAGHQNINLYFYAGMEGGTLFPSVSLIKKNMDVNRLYYDMKVPHEAAGLLDKNAYPYHTILNALDEACLFLDFRDKGSAAFLASVAAAQQFMTEHFYGELCGKETGTGTLSLIGHTHIDVAWLWTLAQTKEKAERSFSTVLKLMKQYPDYVFMSSQPQLYQYVKENDPELYEEIKTRVAEGRFEPEGAMWLEADTNLVSGESLIRQILYGKKFFKEEFGIDNTSLWLPDVFGYSAALPQILKKCGVDTFFTTKISWCETDTFPHDHFIWQGLDGSEVFAVLSDGYVKRLNAQSIMDSMKKHVDKKYTDTQIMTFGYGDGGGGPTAEMLENYERLKKGLPGFPRVKMQKSADTIKEIKKQFDKSTNALRFTPKWAGELYLEMHRGTYTTMARNKKYNRKSEYLYQTLEEAGVLAETMAGGTYPRALIDESWHTILKNQFHDIIPGSSIREVYEVSKTEYEALTEKGEKALGASLDALAASVKTDGGYFVYNPTSFARSGLVDVDGKTVFVKDIPAHGYAVVKESEGMDHVKADEKHIENACVRVTFNDKMNIISFYDKDNERELIPNGECANVLEVFEDYPREYDAWEITEYYKQKKWLADDVTKVEVIGDEKKAGVRVTRVYNHSTITQDITLCADSARLDFETFVDWHEDHVLLKAAFPLDVRANHVDCDIQFGYIERPTHRNTSWDEAKFEICAHKWVDMSDGSYGAALLNDCKYGYSVEENVLGISLLKAPTYPNPDADRGENRFTYALYPHAGTLAASDVIKEGIALNRPLLVKSIAAQSGVLPEHFSFVSADRDTTVVETVKKAESDDGIILRVFDAAGVKTNTTLTFGKAIKEAYECDMLENVERTLATDGKTVKLGMKPFEIRTIKIVLG